MHRFGTRGICRFWMSLSRHRRALQEIDEQNDDSPHFKVATGERKVCVWCVQWLQKARRVLLSLSEDPFGWGLV